MKWDSENTTYYDRGRRAYCKGDTLSDEVIKDMGPETLAEYIDCGLIVDEVEKEESERDRLFQEAVRLGLKPAHNTGVKKLAKMIGEYDEPKPDSEE